MARQASGYVGLLCHFDHREEAQPIQSYRN